MSRDRTLPGWYDEARLIQEARRAFKERVRDVLRFRGAPASRGLPSESRLSAGIDVRGFYTYPLLFYVSFPEVSLQQLQELSLCGSYMFDHVLALDELFDRPSSRGDLGTTILADMLHREATSILCGLFPSNSVFWDYYHTYYGEFIQATLRERARHHCIVTPYSESDLETIYAGKAAIGKISIAALAILGSREDLVPAFAASHDAFHVGYQLLDDMQDLHLDYRRRHYSYPLTWAFLEAGWKEAVESARPPAFPDVRALLGKLDAAGHAREVALAYLKRARDEVETLETTEGSWMAAIQETEKQLQKLRLGGAESPSPRSATRNKPSFSTSFLAVPVPLSWLPWLDRSRAPHINDMDILRAQQAFLLEAGMGPGTLEEVLYAVGLAIDSTKRSFGEDGIEVHLGMSRGELEWCHRNDAWLQSLLSMSLDEPVHLWRPADSPNDAAEEGWLLPAASRYLGYRMVERAREATPATDLPFAESTSSPR